MRWKRGRKSAYIEDRRGRAMGGLPALGAGGGVIGLVIVALMMFMGDGGGDGGGRSPIDDILGQLENPRGQGSTNVTEEDRRLVEFMSFVLDDVQAFWDQTFEAAGRDYEEARLVLFEDATRSACGGATSDIGPHYCPPDQRVYLDLDFFRALRRDFGAPGDFAQAYVLAHEIAHHVQNLLGIEDQVRTEQQRNPSAANEQSIRMELQADCFAGVWAYTTNQRDLLEAGDLEEGLDAAAAVGDDRIQKQAQGTINRETWTHGSSAQRVSWFRRGFQTGDPTVCDTFGEAI